MIRRILNKLESIYKYRYLTLNEKSGYEFLLKNIIKGTDIDFIESVWQLDHFREVLEVQKIDKKQLKRILILAPHQDDEVIGCGGLLKKLSIQQSDLHIGFITDGAELSNPVSSINTRNEEAEELCQSLGAKMRSLNISNIGLNIKKKHLMTLIDWLNEDWDAIFTIWPIDYPPKHRLCSYLIGSSLEKIELKQLPIYFYSVHTDLMPNYYEDISDVIDDKKFLLHIYKSQLKAQRYDHLSRGLDAWRSRFLPVSNKPRFIEIYLKIPVEAYKDFQKIYENVQTDKLFKSHEACIKSFQSFRKLKNKIFD